MGINLKIIILFVLLKTSILSQSSNYFEDSLKIDIKFNFEKLELEVAFINTGVSDCKLPWKEHFPYSDFDNEVAAFNIYIGFENQIKLLKITENIPTFVFEEDNLNIKAGKTVIKVIQLKPYQLYPSRSHA